MIEIKKEEFKLAEKEMFAFESYITKKNEILIIIRSEAFNIEGIEYAQFILNKYLENKEMVIEHLLEKRLRKCYENIFDEDFIKNNLNNPQIEIIEDGWAVITWLNHNLDEHIIELEVNRDFQLLGVTLDG